MQKSDNTNLLYFCSFLLFFSAKPLVLNIGAEELGFNFIFLLELMLFAYAIGNSLFQYVITSKCSILFGVLVVYHCVNFTINDTISFDRQYVQMFRPLIENYIMLNLSCFLFLWNTEKALKYVCVGYLLNVLLTFNIVSVDPDFDNRLNGLVHSNELAQCAGMGLLLLVYMKYYLRLSYVVVLLLSTLFIVAIIGAGSRNGFLLFLFFTVMLMVTRMFQKNIDMKNYLINILILLSVGICITYMLTSTGLGERVLASSEKAKLYNLGTDTYLDKLGERGFYYVRGWANFLVHPLLGIGMWNFGPYNHFPAPLHSEYMIHLCEGGLIGIAVYGSFVYQFLKNLLRDFFHNRNEYTFIPILIFVAYMAVGITAREFYYIQFYPLLGFCLYSILKHKLHTHLWLNGYFSK